MRKILLLLLACPSVFAQVTTLPNSIGIGNGTNSNIPLHINKSNELIRLDGTGNPFMTFYNSGSLNGYIQTTPTALTVGSSNLRDLELRTNTLQRIVVDGTSGQSTFYYKINANNGIKLVGPLQVAGESVGADGMILVSKGNSTPAWEERKIGFQAYLTSNLTIPNYSATTLTNFTESFDYTNSFNSTSGVFTAPATGLYSFMVDIPININATGAILNNPAIIYLYKNGTVTQQKNFSIDVLQNYINSISANFLIELAQNDTVNFQFLQVTGTTISIKGGDHIYKIISGYKIF